jgi:hypothetical protein
MKVRLCFRVALLTVTLLMLVSTFKTRPCAACSPGWYEGCLSGCERAYQECSIQDTLNPMSRDCASERTTCTRNCDFRLAKCNGGGGGGGGGFEEQPIFIP